jgi:hypothetical protein
MSRGTDTRHGALVPIFIDVPPAEIAILKFLFESYEGVAVVRTLDRHEATIVALVSSDFLEVARGMLDSLAGKVEFREIPAPHGANEDWLLRVLWEGETAGETSPRP